MSNNYNLILDSAKESLNEYIELLYSVNFRYISDSLIYEKLEGLESIKDEITKASNIEELYDLKSKIKQIEDFLEIAVKKIKMSSLTGREKALVERGYDIDEVYNLSFFTEEQAQEISDVILERLTRNCTRVNNPICVYFGGQPGSGKSVASMKLKSTFNTDGIVEIGIDNYRTYHPNYLEMEKTIKKYWEDKTPTENSSPGNDIADFTHNFAGRVTDILIEKASKSINGAKYNMVMEWGMRTPEGPLASMKDLKEKGYVNLVNFIAVHKDISLEACRIRADIMNTQKHIVRRVPKSFHDLAVSTLPDSCDTIYQQGVVNGNIVDELVVTTRDNRIIWNKDNYKNPGLTYSEYLHNPELSKGVINEADLAKLSYISETYGFGILSNEISNGKKM